MAGYTRQDTANNIANGNVIDADDFDAEYDAIELAFASSGGHTHDGTTGGGSPITKVGPVQDLVISAAALTPKTTNTLDLGTSAVQFKNAWFDGTVDTDALTVSGSSTIGGNLAVTGTTTLSSTLTASTVDINGGDIDGTTIGSSSHTTGKFTTLQSTGQATLATVDINGGTIDGAAIGSTSPSSGAFTTIDSSGGITGNVTGTVSDVSNHDTDDIAEGSTNQYFTTARARSSVSATEPLSYDSSTGVISFTQGNTDTVAEGETNLYFTEDRARDSLSASGSLSYDSDTGAFTYTQGNTDTVAEGSTNLYYSDTLATAAAKAAISVTDSGGDGSLSYSDGVITYTGPSDTDTRAHFSGGTGVTITDGVVAIGQAVSTTSDVTFNDAVVNGNLTVNGTTTTVNTETLNLADNQIVFNSNETGTPTQNGGIEIERGTEDNKTLVWNEADDKWTVGSETFVAGTFEGSVTGAVNGNVTGNVTGNVDGNVTGDVTGNSDTATTLETARTITIAGDVTATATSFDGSADITLTTAQANNSVDLGTHTTGSYVESLVAGTGVTLTNNSGEGATPTVAIGQGVGTTSDVTFNDMTVSGDLTVLGSTTISSTSAHVYNAVTGTTPSLDVGSYNYFDNGILSGDTTVSFTSVPTNRNWRYSYKNGVAWDVSEGIYEQSFDISTEDSQPYGISFKPDGLKMYVLGNTDDEIHEYDLTTAWDISTASLLQSESISSGDTSPKGLFFKPDGTKLYISGDTGNEINTYNLSTAWDISTLSLSSSHSISAVTFNPKGLFFKSDGTKMYLVDSASSNDRVIEWTLSTAWAPATKGSQQTFSVSTQTTSAVDIFFKSDGTKMYVTGDSTAVDMIFEYSLSTAWDISTASYTDSLNINANTSVAAGLFFKPDGSIVYLIRRVSDEEVTQYNIPTSKNLTLPSSVVGIPSATSDGDRVTLEFVTSDGGTTVDLIGESIISTV